MFADALGAGVHDVARSGHGDALFGRTWASGPLPPGGGFSKEQELVSPPASFRGMDERLSRWPVAEAAG